MKPIPFIKSAIVISTIAIATTTPAKAQIASMSFTGFLWDVSGDFSSTALGALAIGDTWSWDFTVDTSTPDFYPTNPEYARYTNPFVTSTFSAGAGSTNGLGNGQIIVSDNHSFFGDNYIAELFGIDGNISIELILHDPTLTALDSDQMPTSFNLNNFSIQSFQLRGPNDAFAEGMIITPAPGSAALLAAAGFMGTRRRR